MMVKVQVMDWYVIGIEYRSDTRCRRLLTVSSSCGCNSWQLPSMVVVNVVPWTEVTIVPDVR